MDSAIRTREVGARPMRMFAIFASCVMLALAFSFTGVGQAYAYDDYWDTWSSTGTPNKLDITSVSDESLELAAGESATLTFGVSPTSANLEQGCGYCSSMGGAKEGCGYGCIDKWGYCSCTGMTSARTTYIYAESSDTSVAQVTYTGTTATVTVADGAAAGATATITARARLDAPSPKMGVEEPGRYGRQSAAKTITVTVAESGDIEIDPVTQSAYSVAAYREAQYGEPPEGDSSNAGQHILATITYDDAVVVTDAEAAAASITYALNNGGTAWTGVTVSSEGNNLLIDGSLSFAAMAAVIDISAEKIDGVTVGGAPAAISPIKTLAATGLAIEPVKIVKGSATKPATSTYKVTHGANVRSMNHMAWLTNKDSSDETSASIIQPGANVMDQSTTAHHHMWYQFTSNDSASSIASNASSLANRGYTVTNNEDGTFTITANEAVEGEILSAYVLDDIFLREYGFAYTAEIAGVATPEAEEPLKITTQPVDATAALKQTAEFAIETNDEDAVYRWEYSEDGEKWGQSYLTGWKTSEFSFAVTAARADRLYRCKVTFSDGETVYSDTVRVKAPEPASEVAVTATPEKASAKLKDTVEFKASVEGAEDADKYTFLWYYSEDNGENWAQSYLGGWKTDTFTFAVTSARAERIYRVKATAPSGAEIFSEPVSIELASDTATSAYAVSI